MSVDPLFKQYPWQSTYIFAVNNPITFIDFKGLGADDPQKHTVKKGETLTSISKKYGVSVDDLMKLNKSIKNKDFIKEGQILNVNPETDFTNNPRGGYSNPNNNEGEQVSMDHVANIGIGFVTGAGQDNMIIKDGHALEQIQDWDAVVSKIDQLVYSIYEDKVVKPGEAYVLKYSPGNIGTFLGKVWRNEEDLISPVHVIGSFSISVRVNSDGKTMTICLYDSKTISSLSDNNLGSGSNIERNNSDPKPLTTQYIRFIWVQQIPPCY